MHGPNKTKEKEIRKKDKTILFRKQYEEKYSLTGNSLEVNFYSTLFGFGKFGKVTTKLKGREITVQQSHLNLLSLSFFRRFISYDLEGCFLNIVITHYFDF